MPKIQRQLRPTDELIVVDNGSTDNTVAVAKDFGAEVVREPVRGRSRARNSGINRSRGEMVVFIDADCTPQEAWLSELLKPFNDPTTGCVAGEIHHFDNGTPFSAYLTKRGHLGQAGPLQHPFLPYAQSGNAAYRRVVLDQIGLFDEVLWAGHDADLSWRMQLETPYKIVAAPRALVNHCQDASFRGFLEQKRRHAHGAVLLYKKYQKHRQGEAASIKETYWEYRSIFKRAFSCALQSSASYLGWRTLPNRDQHYQLVIELGEKLGRLEGSIRNLVWYP